MCSRNLHSSLFLFLFLLSEACLRRSYTMVIAAIWDIVAISSTVGIRGSSRSLAAKSNLFCWETWCNQKRLNFERSRNRTVVAATRLSLSSQGFIQQRQLSSSHRFLLISWCRVGDHGWVVRFQCQIQFPGLVISTVWVILMDHLVMGLSSLGLVLFWLMALVCSEHLCSFY